MTTTTSDRVEITLVVAALLMLAFVMSVLATDSIRHRDCWRTTAAQLIEAHPEMDGLAAQILAKEQCRTSSSVD